MFQKSSKRVAITLALIMIASLALAACTTPPAEAISKCAAQGHNTTITVDGYEYDCDLVLDQAAAAATALVAPTPTLAQATGPAVTQPVTTTVTVPPTALPAPTGPLGMKYQFDAGCAQTSTPMEYPACILQRVQGGELTGEQAVVMIQQLGAKYEAPSFEGMNLAFANTQPVLAWCPGGVNSYPPDTARPLEGTTGSKWANLLFVVDAGTGGPDRKIEAKESPCWMVYLR